MYILPLDVHFVKFFDTYMPSTATYCVAKKFLVWQLDI